ncbi:hypothetical protein SMACR_09282 [Sordaria macrospora]|uniref:WGS project CABT00000000 data, contig 2.83 n=2 Tax=Sordaria macrospora TaxID=5147 RepID=F7WBS0_SORMK|nr:uncharacterized protein SMAC_09282 [Sordaria macrospora k-hell]KAA8628205.1 hypothetical protein SMACR_09282 [Sordaria macrospora]KAH7627818.1 hypothetical protein B0T09DRAFT_367341 [Sordaria sp. MPI-SDFR-AT-0083]WPJ65276.1 hypothetical protein SMAC4_09282 [Sordaria macrospora]CCC05485.1 unnamed protein product [Sordaria macrospora k-hell]
MRYDDWDVILFPTGRDGKIPIKEFKVQCHVVPDQELAHMHGQAGLPVMTCFIPSLPAGSPFQISMHAWKTPDISLFTKTYSRHTDFVKFEARIFIDGRLVASTAFDRKVNGPHLIADTFDYTKTGERERLKFPTFRRELLYESHWSPGDDLGRIKVLISEGFPRDSLTVPFERVKNIVAFSFQHAPLELLENNSIAWPNPSMWRTPTYISNVPVPTYHPNDGINSHTHSPQRAKKSSQSPASFPTPIMTHGVFQPQPPTTSYGGTQTLQMPYAPRGTNTGSGSSLSYPDPFTEPSYMNWVGSMGNSSWQSGMRRGTQQQSSDETMPDYGDGHNRDQPEVMHVSGHSMDDEHPTSMKVPTNTPTTLPPRTEDMTTGVDFPSMSTHMPSIPPDMASCLTNTLLNQPMPLPLQPHQIPLPSSDFKSRKENRFLTISGSNPSSAYSTPSADHSDVRKFSQPAYSQCPIASNLSQMVSSMDGAGSSSDSPSLQSMFSVAESHQNSPRQAEFGSSSNMYGGHTSCPNPPGFPPGLTSGLPSGLSSGLPSAPPSSLSSHLSPYLTMNSPTSFSTNPTSNPPPGPTPFASRTESSLNAGLGSGQGNVNDNRNDAASGSGNGNGNMKRARNFTPASTKAIDEEDEPRRPSPHVRTRHLAKEWGIEQNMLEL